MSNEDLSLKEVRAKRNNFALKIGRTLQSLEESANYDIESKKLEEAMYTNMGIKSYFSNSSSKRRIMREEKRELERKATRYLVEELFFEIFYNGLYLDENYKEAYKDILREKSDEFIGKVCDNNICNDKNEFTDRIIKMQPIGDLVVSKKAENNDEKIILTPDEEVEIERIEEENKDFINESAKIIKTKVLEVVAEEKHLSLNREKILRENKRFNGKTLFNGITNINYKRLVSEDIDVSGQLMEDAFVESIIDYTLLETVNTLKLVEFNVNSVNKGINKLYN